MRKVNYHTHTYRCGHAQGTEEEMVASAVEFGIEQLGMCCHVPLPHYRKHLAKSMFFVRSPKSLLSLCYSFITDGLRMRMPYKQLEEHLQKVQEAQDKYKDKIVVYQGFEAEGLKEYFDYYQLLLSEHKVDYLILGHHFNQHCIHSCYYGRPKIKKKDIYQYCNDIEQAIETNLFSYIAHPDLFLIGYHDFGIDMQTVSRRICEKAKEYNIPLEINAGGIRRGLKNIDGKEVYLYPNTYFWKIASEVGNDVILGFDAHSPSDFDEEIYQKMLDFADEHQLHIIDHLEFLKGKE